jgi:hypothetical protein
MPKKEIPSSNNDSLDLEVGKTILPFANMRIVRGAPNFEFSNLHLKFRQVNFELSVSRNEGRDVDNEEGVDVFYEIRLKGRIDSMEKIKWLQQHRIDFSVPQELRKEYENGFLAVMLFKPEEFHVDPEAEIKNKGFVDLVSETDVYNFAFQSDKLRKQIKMTVLPISSQRND